MNNKIAMLKNDSGKGRDEGVVLEREMTEHPISNTREWISLPKDKYTGEIDKFQAKGFDPKDKSEVYKIVINPSETVKFGEGQKFNLEHAEFLYKFYGTKEDPERPVRNWLIEVDEEGNEVKGSGSWHERYRQA